ncbi:MAG TPA: glycoside hydrolase family 43 protein [Sphingomicrobium sp.]|nr:glycoside hydrolase family 43 protein [Sphingomicrobium sp.]
MRPLLALFAAALALCGCTSLQFAPPESAYHNPVLDADFPDPAVIRAPDGFYYAFATQTERNGKWLNIQVARSADLVRWEHLGDALPAKPGWAAKTQDFWAPDVVRDGSRYIMYYSAKPDTADERHGLCLAAATANSPAGPYVDIGRPLQCGEGFVNIDPMAFDDPATGKHLLYWGSGFQPIKVQELAPGRLAFAAGSAPKTLVWPNPVKDAFPVLVEGAWVIRREGWYYLFYSGDNCCGTKANYAVMVARSRSATGPFETLEQATGKPHSIILEKNGHWVAPGHNSTITDAAGRDWILYHAVDARRPREKATDEVNTRRVMLIDRIIWENGWPVVKRAEP